MNKYVVTGRMMVSFSIVVEAENEDCAEEAIDDIADGNLLELSDWIDIDVTDVAPASPSAKALVRHP